ncbi:unnamed protein product, partial [Vitis vinifera]|uniref:Uncharacterized protein n=1 Tax=Vitis vinifera TaxID=29760 RepID=D7TX32_VITVI
MPNPAVYCSGYVLPATAAVKK